MRTDLAFMMGQASKGNEQMVFDWAKAARLIVEHMPIRASAGLRSDWEWTGGIIYANGAPVEADDTHTYLSSNWAIPELDLDGEIIPCFVWDHETEWNESSYWPQEAMDIFYDVVVEDNPLLGDGK